jgi:hemerythrin-like domain-containing protein
MDAIETLMNEHRLIERAIDALVAFAGEAGRRRDDDKTELGRFVSFIREFADACHHGKEEEILFEAMVAAGFPRQAGPIGVMLAEHAQGRAHVGALAALAGQAEPWSPGDRERLAAAAHGYAELLRGHIHKEDAILYPMAEQRLPGDLMERVQADCEAFEARQAASGEHERLQQLGRDLVARHAPLIRDEPQPAQRPHLGCCG